MSHKRWSMFVNPRLLVKSYQSVISRGEAFKGFEYIREFVYQISDVFCFDPGQVLHGCCRLMS